MRDALRALEQEGLVRRVQGSGTFVAHPRVPNSLDMNFGVTAAIRQGGMRPGVEQARHWVEPAAANESERLALGPGEDVLVIDRVRTADGRPVVVSRDVLPHKLLRGRDDVIDALLAGSVYAVLEDEFGITIQYGIASFCPVRAEHSLADRLRVEPGELLFYLWQVDYAESGDPVLSSHEYHLADAFEFSVVRRRSRKEGHMTAHVGKSLRLKRVIDAALAVLRDLRTRPRHDLADVPATTRRHPCPGTAEAVAGGANVIMMSKGMIRIAEPSFGATTSLALLLSGIRPSRRRPAGDCERRHGRGGPPAGRRCRRPLSPRSTESTRPA